MNDTKLKTQNQFRIPNYAFRIDKGQHQETFLNSLLALVAAGLFFASKFIISSQIVMIVLVASFIAAIFLLRRESQATFIPFCIIFFMLGVVRYQTVENLPANDISNYAGSEVRVEGIIREQPRIRLNADNTYSVRYVVDVKTIKKDQKDLPVTGGLNINARYKDKVSIPTALIGYKISSYGTVRKPLNYNNPGQLDVVTMLKNDCKFICC